MKIPYRWIGEFVELRLGAAAAADRLVNAGLEVASVTPLAPAGLAGVVVGEIEAIERELGESHGHRLLLCRVSTGRERFSVISGAPNTTVGTRAAFAPPGATLPGGRRIAAAKIRGVESQGMLCSERELGLGDEHEAGLLVLDGDARPGQDLVAHLGLDDHVLEIEITPNRPDCLSVVGVARELAALTGSRLRVPAPALRESGAPARTLARVRIEAPDLCHRFTARVVSGVRVGPSPAWLGARLRAVGLRPISNVVDVTNYVLWERGHPLHAFDYDTLAERTIVVRRAGKGERFTTLDGQERVLDDAMLVIADPGRAVGLAGVMGGANTEVTGGTTRVLLESAYFDPVSIRRTSRALGLRTDAAYRFERGADVEALVGASARAAGLIAELAGGTLARGMVDVYPRRRKPVRVRLRMSRVKRVLGVAPPAAKARAILAGLGLPTRAKGAALDVEIPSFRRDLAMEDDLVEEIVRVWGYDKLRSTLPASAVDVVTHPPALRQAQVVRRALAGAGLAEAVTHAFGDPGRAALLRAAGAPEPLGLLNPLAQDASVLRSHPLEGLLGAVSVNLRRQQPDVALFEICTTYERAAGETGAAEPRWAAIALSGGRTAHAWHTPDAPADVYDAKGLAEHVLAALGVAVTPGGAGRLGGFEPDCHGTLVTAAGAVAAEFGEVAAAVREAFGLDAPVFGAAVALDVAAAAPAPALAYQALPRFPAVQRDLAFVLGAAPALTAAEIEAALAREAGPLLRALTLFDVFRFPDGRRSLAWRLVFQAEDRTLTDDEVNAIQARLTGRITGTFPVTPRSA
ncbi:MAG: phenylalanine--tRNA ligase subunit beta [Candidatus Rokubacteria bacterium]|nr:phenylalanine--tRNA ligase subunit beta [Candidatus Rokubacteria bacterium]